MRTSSAALREDAAYVFKTIYFPRERVRSGSSARVSISIPTSSTSESLTSYLANLSSREFRIALGDPYVDDLEAKAQAEGRSLSNVVLRLLETHFKATGLREGVGAAGEQLALPLAMQTSSAPKSKAEPGGDLGLTFKDSLRQGAFGWYPYVEGFSATYTRDAILRYSPRTVFDPFGGSGTTQLAAAMLGIPSFYSEINPFMCFVADTKVTAAHWARKHKKSFEAACADFEKFLVSSAFKRGLKKVDLASYEAAFPERDFFEENNVRALLQAKQYVLNSDFPAPVRDILLLACASNAVRSSNMTRRADLRRRRADEYKNRVVDVPMYLIETLTRFRQDVAQLPSTMAPTLKIAEDARQVPSEFNNSFDLAITSPPYLNGTNYFRNTKIELWLMGFIKSEKELGSFTRRSIAAGINNVTKGRPVVHSAPQVEAVAKRLDDVADDARIPMLVRQYFSDMTELCASVERSLVPGGAFLLDIGDSKFYGVHVPTDELLVEAAKQSGLTLKNRHVLARRHSRDKSELVQVELVFEKRAAPVKAKARSKPKPGASDLSAKIDAFQRDIPYKDVPFSKRNWGHGLHSLCSYQGKLKPAMAHWLVKEFVPPKGRVLDPLGGVGTIPFEAALMGRDAVSNDKSPFASIVARAKLAPPTPAQAERAFKAWWKAIESIDDGDVDLSDAAFGINGLVSDYFHKDTLMEVMKARLAFARARKVSDTQAFFWASLLHVLHGNRPYALSRTSHPITPFHPKGPTVYKSVKDKVWARVSAALSKELPSSFKPGLGLHGDFRALDAETIGTFDAVITSPPFLGMRFDRPNWLRLWFCGWGKDDFHKTSLDFLERQQIRSRDVYAEFFSTLRPLMKPNGLLVVHLGSGKDSRLVDDLKHLADDKFSLRGEVRENVQAVEQHGIRDKGLTTSHHLLFLTPR